METLEGTNLRQNAVQKWLWGCWQDCWAWVDDVVGDDDWALIVNGDAVEGNHHGTREIISAEDGDHATAAYHCLKPHAAKASKRYLVMGTECHTKEAEHNLAKQLNCDEPDGPRAAWPELRITIAGTLCHFRHHITTTSRPYLEGSALSIHLGVERQEAARAGHDTPRVMVRSHRHRFGVFDDGFGLGVVTPPWQALTRYGQKVVPAANVQVGAVVLDWRDRGDDEIPDVRKRLHTAKQPKGVTL
jgi:hypothetical protein